MTGDPRADDVEQAGRLFALAERDGSVRLPDLLGVDLCALGYGGQSLVDGPLLTTWAGLAAQARSALAVEALTGLVARGLLDPPDDSGPAGARDGTGTVELGLRASLSMILAARTRPTLLATCTVPGRQQYAEPRLYGLGDEDVPVRALVAEQASRERVVFGTGERVELPPAEAVTRAGDLNQVFHYALFSPERAGRVLASWARADAVPEDAALPRTVDVYHHAEGGLTRDRVQVQRGAGTMTVELSRDGGPPTLASGDPDGLAGLLAGLVEGGY